MPNIFNLVSHFTFYVDTVPHVSHYFFRGLN